MVVVKSIRIFRIRIMQENLEVIRGHEQRLYNMITEHSSFWKFQKDYNYLLLHIEKFITI